MPQDTSDRPGQIELKPGERLDSLQFEGLQIIQRPDSFRFGTDAVLLADFASARSGDYVVDMGTGTGIISILMASRQPRSRYAALRSSRKWRKWRGAVCVSTACRSKSRYAAAISGKRPRVTAMAAFLWRCAIRPTARRAARCSVSLGEAHRAARIKLHGGGRRRVRLRPFEDGRTAGGHFSGGARL